MFEHFASTIDFLIVEVVVPHKRYAAFMAIESVEVFQVIQYQINGIFTVASLLPRPGLAEKRSLMDPLKSTTK